MPSQHPPIHLPTLIANTRLPEGNRFRLYLNTCRKEGRPPWRFLEWQVRDLEIARDPKITEIMLLRNRGGSKSRDASVLAVWLAYQLNSHGDPNRIIWFAGADTQLAQVKGYFRENRYVTEVTSKEKIPCVVCKNGNLIELRIMTEKQAVSKRADVLIFDEEEKMKDAIYGQALGTQVGGGKKKVHLGTTELDTVFETNFQRLNPLGLVLEHHIDECRWTSLDAELANYAGRPQFEIDSQLYCQWVRPGGCVFENVKVGTWACSPALPKYAGIDPNPKSGHAWVGVRYPAPYTIYVEEELPPFTDSFAFSRTIKNKLTYNLSVEIEENAGEEFLKILEREIPKDYRKKVGAQIGVLRWDADNKRERVYQIRKYQIIVNPNCTQTLHHIRSAAWNPKDPVANILKTPTQHYLDAFIHACQGEAGATVVGARG